MLTSTPDQAPLGEQHAAKVAELCRFIEEAEQLPTRDDLAARAAGAGTEIRFEGGRTGWCGSPIR